MNGAFGEPELRPLSSVRYESLSIDLSAVSEPDDLEAALFTEIQQCAEVVAAEGGDDLAHISLHLILIGATPVARLVEATAQQLTQDLDLLVAGASVDIERFSVQVRPAIDLAELAGSKSALGTTARLLLELEDRTAPQSPETTTLLTAVRDRIERAQAERYFSGLPRRPVDDDLVREYLLTAVRALLTSLQEQA